MSRPQTFLQIQEMDGNGPQWAVRVGEGILQILSFHPYKT
jgi:hypothetical protein